MLNRKVSYQEKKACGVRLSFWR